MILDLKRGVIELEYRGIVPVKDAVGTRIDCLRGRIWITEHGSIDDIVLEDGESYVISRGGIAVVQALRGALIGLRAPALSCSNVRSGLLKHDVEVVGWHIDDLYKLKSNCTSELDDGFEITHPPVGIGRLGRHTAGATRHSTFNCERRFWNDALPWLWLALDKLLR